MSDQESSEQVEGVEEAAPAEEAFGTPEGGVGPRLSAEEALADAQDDRLRSRAGWSLVDRELFAFLFANCLFFAGALASWTARVPGAGVDTASEVTGLHTIRGALIFALAIYGFWTAVFNIWHRQMKVWPYLLNALLAEWVGISVLMNAFKGPTWDATIAALKAKSGKTLADDVLYRLGVVPPGAWLLVLGGIIVFVVLIRGIMAGSQKAKARAGAEAAAGGGRRRR